MILCSNDSQSMSCIVYVCSAFNKQTISQSISKQRVNLFSKTQNIKAEPTYISNKHFHFVGTIIRRAGGHDEDEIQPAESTWQ